MAIAVQPLSPKRHDVWPISKKRQMSERLDFISKGSVRMRTLVRFAGATMLLAPSATMANPRSLVGTSAIKVRALLTARQFAAAV